MSILSNIFGTGIAEPIVAVKDLLDTVFTSDEEKLDKKILMERVSQSPNLATIELNKKNSEHKSKFVAGWRPYIGYVAGTCIGLFYIPQLILANYLWYNACLKLDALVPFPMSDKALMELVYVLLGFAGYRTFEKLAGRA